MEMTIRELCNEVARTGNLKTDQESVVAYQDMIGHANTSELVELSNTMELVESFYRIYGEAYGTCAAIKFYMSASDKVTELRDDLELHKADAKKFYDEIQDLKEQLIAKDKVIKELNRDMDGTLIGVEELKSKLKKKDLEIMELKSLLYDAQQKAN